MDFSHSASPDPINLIDLISLEHKDRLAKARLGCTVVNEFSRTHDLKTQIRTQGVTPRKSILKVADMAFQGVDLTSEAGQVAAIDWRYVFLDKQILFQVLT